MDGGRAGGDRRGAIDMVIASFGFAWMGLLVKVVAETVPVSQVVAWRTLITAVVVGLFAWRRGTSLRPVNLGMQVVRALAGLVSMSCYFLSLSRLPLGDAVLITYLSPILVAMMSRRSTGEVVSRRVWAGSLLGLLGVALVVRPTGSTDWIGVGAALSASLFSAFAYLSVRVLTRTDPPEVIVFWFSAVGGLLASLSFVPGIVVPTASVGVAVLAMGVLGGVAQHFMTRAYARGDVATMSVFSYSTPVFAYLLQAVWHRELPPMTSLAGAACVVGAGIWVARG